jgi:MFS family permease
MNLTCVDRSTINYMVTAYFVAYGFAGLFLFSLPDRCGRKKTITIFGTVHILAQFTILFVPLYSVRFVCYGVMGAC